MKYKFKSVQNFCLPSKDNVTAWALVSHVLKAVHAKGDAHAAPESNGAHQSSCNPGNNTGVLNRCCCHLGLAVWTLHVHRALPKHPGSNILMLDKYGGWNLTILRRLT